MPVCPFCRSSITQLVVVKFNNTNSDTVDLEFSPSQPRTSRKSVNLNEGSSSYKSHSPFSSFGKMGGRNSGKVAADCDDRFDKL